MSACLIEIATLLEPFMPETAAKIQTVFGSGILKPLSGTLFPKAVQRQKARNLSLGLYGALEKCPDRAFKNQLLRASVSSMNNLAEGFERGSDREFIQFLYIAKGS